MLSLPFQNMHVDGDLIYYAAAAQLPAAVLSQEQADAPVVHFGWSTDWFVAPTRSHLQGVRVAAVHFTQ